MRVCFVYNVSHHYYITMDNVQVVTGPLYLVRYCRKTLHLFICCSLLTQLISYQWINLLLVSVPVSPVPLAHGLIVLNLYVFLVELVIVPYVQGQRSLERSVLLVTYHFHLVNHSHFIRSFIVLPWNSAMYVMLLSYYVIVWFLFHP